MSLVMVIATENFIVMSGDYRRTYISDESVVFDDTPKVFSISNHVLIGLTGDIGPSKQILQLVKGTLDEDTSVEGAARFIKKHLKQIVTKDTQQTIHIAGKARNGEPAIIVMTHRNSFKLDRTDIPKNHIKWSATFSFEDPIPLIEKGIAELESITTYSVASLVKKVNEYIGERDPRVSRKCDVLGVSF